MKTKILNRIREEFRVEGELSFWNTVHFDSRAVKKGDWFIALVGENSDGHLFVPQAVKNGASVIIVNEMWWNKSQEKPEANYIVVSHPLTALQQIASLYRSFYKKTVIAITGSVGKTTTRNWIASVLKQKFNVSYSGKNYNNHIGLPYSMLSSDLNADFWIMELGSNHPGEIAFLAEILEPDWSLVTTIGTAHLGFFKSKEDVYKEKSSLYDNTKKDGKIFINSDDEFLKGYSKFKSSIKISVEKKEDYSFDFVKKDKVGHFYVKADTGSIIKLPLPGKHLAINALFAYAVGKEAGLEEESIIKGIEELSFVEKRMQIVQETPYMIVNDAYNANKESVIAAGNFLMDVEAERRIMVLGDIFELGDFSQKIHHEIISYLDKLGLEM
ncbi:MAG: UDP-N-acetylmuramoyl-tripeptide--D-alanyl-D-alanine ligase, partial [Calditrichia bacterium]|nr:UDP-N-acetylmuramoyl-tripeptide--D-alanyl-D-alanine ligase [Calditrichia bacterium]